MFSVGENSHADASARRLRLSQVVVQLLYVFRVGIETTGGTDAALELNKGVEGRQVNGLSGPFGRWSFLDDLVTFGQPGEDEKVAHGASDVGLKRTGVMLPKDVGGGCRISGIIEIDLCSHRGTSGRGFARHGAVERKSYRVYADSAGVGHSELRREQVSKTLAFASARRLILSPWGRDLPAPVAVQPLPGRRSRRRRPTARSPVVGRRRLPAWGIFGRQAGRQAGRAGQPDCLP